VFGRCGKGGGCGRLRRSLYAAALQAAFHWKPALKSFIKRFIQAGASHTLVLAACARKRIISANIIGQRDEKWAKHSVTSKWLLRL
jgi:transposase